MNHVTQPSGSPDMSIFYQKSAVFAILRTTDIDCLSFFEYLKIVLINMVPISMVSVKVATLCLLKIKVFWNKVYDIIFFVYDVTNKISLRESNYVANMVMRSKFGNSSVSMREVIITSIL